MQAKLQEFVRLCGRGLVEGLLVFPLIVALTIYFIGEAYIFSVIGILCGLFIGSYVVRKITKENRVLAFTLAGIFVVASLFLFAGWLAKILLLLIGIVAAFRGIQHAENDWKDILTISVLWGAGVSTYFVMYLVFRYMERLSDYTALIGNAGLVFIMVTLLITNRWHLEREANTGRQGKPVSSTIKRLNDVFLVGTIAVVLLITNFSVVQSGIYHFFRSIVQSFVWLVELLGSGEPSHGPPEAPQQEQLMLPMEESVEPSLIAVILDIITVAIGVVIAIFLVLLAISIFVKKVRDLIKNVILWLWNTVRKVFTRRIDLDMTSDYKDEKESVFDWKKWRQERQQAIRHRWQRLRKARPKWEKMNPAEQVRYIVRISIDELKQRDKWIPSLTVREILQLKQETPPEISEWYDRVRYGDGRLSPDEVEQLRIKREKFYNEQ